MKEFLKYQSEQINFGLGTSQISSLGRRLPYKDAVELFKTAFNNGIKIIDTANSYGSGDSETLIGKVTEELNENPFIITKAGFPYSNTFSPFNQITKKLKEKLGAHKNFNADYIAEESQKSLRRLKINKLGAFLLHELTETDIKTFDCLAALKKIKISGAAEYCGISSNVYSVVKKGIESNSIEIVETKVQFGDENSTNIIKLCAEHNIPVIANEIFGPVHKDLYDFENIIKKAQQITGLETVNKIQLLICMTYAENPVNCILIGTKNPSHLVQNIRSTDYVSEVKNNYAELTKIFSDNRKS